MGLITHKDSITGSAVNFRVEDGGLTHIETWGGWLKITGVYDSYQAINDAGGALAGQVEIAGEVMYITCDFDDRGISNAELEKLT